MRQISCKKVTALVKNLCIQANFHLPDDIKQSLKKAEKKETNILSKEIYKQINENTKIADQEIFPLCQDTGMIVILLELGQQVQIKGGSLEEALNEGIRQAYKEKFLRKSVVSNPLTRQNSQDNTPAIIHYELFNDDRFNILLAPKGFGSENMSRLKILKPTAKIEEIEEFLLSTVKEIGGKSCPPNVIGIGIGGNFEKCAYLSKKASLRVLQKNPNPKLNKLEKKWCKDINNLGIGPQGLGGKTSCLAVHIETFATHIASLPVAINIACHADRRAYGSINNY